MTILFFFILLCGLLFLTARYIVTAYIQPMQDHLKHIEHVLESLRNRVRKLEGTLSYVPKPDQSIYGELPPGLQNLESQVNMDEALPSQYDSLWSEVEDIKARGERLTTLGSSRPIYPGQL
jgi:hypothetical protein